MKKLLLSILIASSLLSCSSDNEQTSISAESKKEISMKNTDGTIVKEIPTVVFEKIVAGLRKNNESEKITFLNANYKDDNGTTKLISSSAKSSKTTSKAANEVTFSYRAHVTGTLDLYGWQPWVGLGFDAGTTGLSKRIEALQFTSNIYIPGFQARAHVQGLGWLAYVGLGQDVGTVGLSRRAEAFQIYVPSSFATNVVYQVHVQNLGWMTPVNNGEIAGTTGQNLRVEKI
jgi:uncharacterized protein YjdB